MSGSRFRLSASRSILLSSRNTGVPDFLHQVENLSVLSIPLPLGIDNQQDQLAALKRRADLGHHLAIERGSGTMHSRRVDQYDLSGLLPFFMGRLLLLVIPILRPSAWGG